MHLKDIGRGRKATALYNIGARYFIHGVQKYTSENMWLTPKVKIHGLSNRILAALSS